MTTYQTIPISLNVTSNSRALVVGGGNIALQKIEWLLKFNMEIHVAALAAIEQIEKLNRNGDIHFCQGPYDGLSSDFALVIAATDNADVNRQVYEHACARGIPVNVVDVPELCTFFVPSVISRGRLQMTIASQGDAPALCKRLRKEMEALVPPFYEAYVEMLADARKTLRAKGFSDAVRGAILKHMASQQISNTLAQLPAVEQRARFETELERVMVQANSEHRPGTVYLVGAGPGDPGLISVKGLRALASADAVLYDGLVNSVLLAGISDSVEQYDTAKRAGCANQTQADINELMVKLAKEGKTVCRLKGGDPCVFGRVTSEARTLAEHHIPFEIVSGVSSSIGALAYAGIPVTDRDAASYFQVVTGHESPGKTESRVNWQDIARSLGTVVFLMGVHRLRDIAEKLISHGKPPTTPLAIISHGTLPTQQVFETTLEKAADTTLDVPDMPRPSLIVVGGVVRLRKELKWFK